MKLLWKIDDKVISVLKAILADVVITGIMLAILAFMLYKLRLTEAVIRIGVILIYVIANFVAGFLIGKHMGNKKFLWGMLVGTSYFLILTIVSVIMDHSGMGGAGTFVTTLLICAGSGTVGGMVA